MKIVEITVGRNRDTSINRDNPLGQDRGYHAKVKLEEDERFYFGDGISQSPATAVAEAFNVAAGQVVDTMRATIKTSVQVEF